MGNWRNAHIPWAFLRRPQPMGVTSEPVGVSQVGCKTPTERGRFTNSCGRFSCWLKDAHSPWAFHPQPWAFSCWVARRPQPMGVTSEPVGVLHIGCKTPTARGRFLRKMRNAQSIIKANAGSYGRYSERSWALRPWKGNQKTAFEPESGLIWTSRLSIKDTKPRLLLIPEEFGSESS